MVGIVGKSRGCAVCRKRKIKCDRQRPTCGQCNKGKRICGGYDTATVFLNHFADTFTKIPSQTSQISDNKSLSWNDADTDGCGDKIVATRHSYSSINDFAHSSRLERHQLLANFVDSTLPRQQSRVVPLSWIIDVANTPGDSNALSYAGAAIGNGWIGHFDKLTIAVKQGRRNYLMSLASLRKALSERGEVSAKEQLTTMALLLLYELIEFGTDQASGWVAHTEGIESTIAHATPQTFVAAANHKLFLFCRTVIILRSLTIRRKSVLALDQWKHGPWMLHSKSSFHQLLDLAADVAAILEDFDNSREEHHPTSPRSRRVAASIALVLLRLKQWEKLHGYALPESPLTVFSGPLPAPKLNQYVDKDFVRHWYPSRYPKRSEGQFLLLQQARLMLFFWALVTSIQTCVLEMRTLPPFPHNLRTTQPTSERRNILQEDITMTVTTDDAAICAKRISTWFNFASQDAWQSFGPVFGVFSLKSAIAWYQAYQYARLPDLEIDRAKELEQCQSLLEDFINYGSPRTQEH